VCDGLSIVFPNIYQHHQTSFALLNPSKPGHQTVIAFFLVDPDIQPIVSTAGVAPQQKQWVKQAVDESLDKRVPVEVVERIMGYVEGLMEVEEAEGYGRAFLEGRESFREANNNYHFCIPFDIWSAPEFWHYQQVFDSVKAGLKVSNYNSVELAKAGRRTMYDVATTVDR
jgi:hypothetical protein